HVCRYWRFGTTLSGVAMHTQCPTRVQDPKCSNEQFLSASPRTADMTGGATRGTTRTKHAEFRLCRHLPESSKRSIREIQTREVCPGGRPRRAFVWHRDRSRSSRSIATNGEPGAL